MELFFFNMKSVYAEYHERIWPFSVIYQITDNK